MALKIIDYNSKEYQQMLALRNDVLRKPLGLQLESADTDADQNNILIGAFDDEKLLGCCMLVKENNEIVFLRQMAVINDVQGKGIGQSLVNFAENLARDIGYKEMKMYARKSVLPFYEKQGYQKIGSEFIKSTIPHITMKKKLV